MIAKVFNKWKPDLSKSIDNLLMDWYLEVTKNFPQLDTNIISFFRRDEFYNRILLTKDIIFEIRPPYEELDTYPGYEWHDDGVGYPYTTMWTNAEPTEILNMFDLREFTFESNDVFILDNRLYKHRAPKIINRNRFYARALIMQEIYG